jgi:hypothetical protein
MIPHRGHMSCREASLFHSNGFFQFAAAVRLRGTTLPQAGIMSMPPALLIVPVVHHLYLLLSVSA